MHIRPYPGYEHFFADPDAVMATLPPWRPPEGLEVADRTLPGLSGEAAATARRNLGAPLALDDGQTNGEDSTPVNPAVPVRIYKPRGGKNLPVVVDLHPGGFTMGGPDMCNERCARFALEVSCVAVAVDYRLAPKHRYPAQLEDILAVLAHICAHPEEYGAENDGKSENTLAGQMPSQPCIALCGTSAGGNLAAGLCLYLRDHGGPAIALQILNYPLVAGLADTPSCLQLGDSGPFVQVSALRHSMDAYLGPRGGAPLPSYAAPLLAADLSSLPPAFVVACEYDPLRDEDIDYARRLQRHGVQAELHSMPRVCHAYDEIPGELTDWVRAGMVLALRRELGEQCRQ